MGLGPHAFARFNEVSVFTRGRSVTITKASISGGGYNLEWKAP
jgi:hypothetical protein